MWRVVLIFLWLSALGVAGAWLADHPGLISSVSRYIAGKGINIHQMKTRQASAPFSATPLFSMSGTLSSFKEVDVDGLKKGLRRLEDDLNVDIDFKET